MTWRKEFRGKCPECNGSVKLVHTSKDGTTNFYQCTRGHKKSGIDMYPVYMVK